MKAVTTHQAKTQLSRLLAMVEQGEEILIKRGNVPVARLVGVGRDNVKRRPVVGTKTSEPVTYATDAFAPLSDEELKAWGL
jgi:antitoxin (DNA-binding transcriptional repressor) of toxin-antitoxin stability system